MSYKKTIMILTGVIENTVYNKKLWGEEGVAFFIEVVEENAAPIRVLFDTGRSGTVLLHNLEILEIEPDNIDYLVLSHGHTGHINGALSLNYKIKNYNIVLHSDIYRQKYKKNNNKIRKSGNQTALKQLNENNIIDIKKKSTYWISKKVVISGNIPIKDKNDPSCSNHFLLKKEKKYIPDQFKEELSIGILSKKGVIILTSCAHRGLINTIRHILSLFEDNMPLYGVIGGFHTLNDKKKTKILIEKLTNYSPKIIAPCHCTGPISNSMLYSSFRESYRYFGTGSLIIV